MQKQAFVIVGLGFGDEGKGLAADFLCCHTDNPIVIRFNGGHQAGHTVVTSTGTRHVFSSFGAGTLRGAPTYWSSYCTFSPTAVVEEYAELPIRPHLLVDNLCPVTTHYDILYNRAIEATREDGRHGSCGLGFGATVERHAYIQLYAADLLEPNIWIEKLQLIRAYYQKKIDQETKFSFSQFDHDTADEQLRQQVEDVLKLRQQGVIEFVKETDIFSEQSAWQTYVFEGAQGILLDMDFGCWPHVTRSNTTSKNALALIARYVPIIATTDILYVTRAYQTRHGAGPLATEIADLNLVNHQEETNQYNPHQGALRYGHLDINALNYALSCDATFSRHLPKSLLVTCLDQLQGSSLCVENGLSKVIAYGDLSGLLNTSFKHTYFSFSSCAEHLQWQD